MTNFLGKKTIKKLYCSNIERYSVQNLNGIIYGRRSF